MRERLALAEVLGVVVVVVGRSAGGKLGGSVIEQRGQAQDVPRIAGFAGRSDGADDNDGGVFRGSGRLVHGVAQRGKGTE